MEPSYVGQFLVYAIIGLSMTLQIEPGTAAVSCDLGETNVSAAGVSSGIDCRKKLQTICGSQRRVVSHLEMNAWDTDNTAIKTCEGCCQVPLPCPVKPPVISTQCPATDTNKTFVIDNYKGKDCHRCRDGCQARCDNIGSRVGDEICGYRMNGKAIVGLICTCCCRKRTPYPPPAPPRPTPSPPRPSPRPPPSSGDNICRAVEDIYLAFRIFYPSSCSSSCSSGCIQKCSFLGTSIDFQRCSQYSSSASMCQCCCKSPPSPLPPPPPSPWFPPFSTPPPPPPSPWFPPSTSPPPTPQENICNAFDRFSEISYFNTQHCDVCLSDCKRQCLASSVTQQTCTVNLNPSSVLCKCCCQRYTGATTSLLSLAAA